MEMKSFYPSGKGAESRDIREYATADGRSLAYVHYSAAAHSRGARIIYIHGLESHAGWFDAAARQLAERGYEVDCLDRRGSGINRENRGFRSGDAVSFETWLSDIHSFIEQCASGKQSRILAGLSWGGKLALAYALGYPEDIAALTLITPGIIPRVNLAWWRKAGVLLGRFTHPTAHIASPVKVDMFTNDLVWQETIRRDPLRLRHATARFFWETRRMDRWNKAHIVKNRVPTLLFLAGQDRIVKNDAVLELLGRGRQKLAVRPYDDQTHSIQLEEPARLAGDIDRWLVETGINLVREKGDSACH